MGKHGTILHETANLYLLETADGRLEIHLYTGTHGVSLGSPKDRVSAERCMARLERYPDKLRALAFN